MSKQIIKIVGNYNHAVSKKLASNKETVQAWYRKEIRANQCKQNQTFMEWLHKE